MYRYFLIRFPAFRCMLLLLVLPLLLQQAFVVEALATPRSRPTTTIGSAVKVLPLLDEEESNNSKIKPTRRHVLQTAAASLTTMTTSATTGGWLLPSSASASATASTSTTSTYNPITTLNDGTKFPLASFGLQIYNDETAYRLTTLALEVGYRNFFASVLARNQRGFAKAVRDSQIPRDQLFICGSVVSNRALGYQAAYEDTTAGWKRNLDAFSAGDITYLDQIMLDYPGPDASSIQGQWASFQAMHQQGLVKTLSVSNFSPSQLDVILKKTSDKYQLHVKPVVNQLPYSVAYHPGNAVQDNQQRDILVQAWAPLGGSLGGRFSSSIKEKCAQIGKPYNKSWAQVALRWIVQTGAAFTTQSQNEQHFQQDLNIFDFELSPQDMQELSALA